MLFWGIRVCDSLFFTAPFGHVDENIYIYVSNFLLSKPMLSGDDLIPLISRIFLNAVALSGFVVRLVGRIVCVCGGGGVGG